MWELKAGCIPQEILPSKKKKIGFVIVCVCYDDAARYGSENTQKRIFPENTQMFYFLSV